MAQERLTTKGERTRDHILDTALTLFETTGYHATTMRDIARAANCSPGLIYRYFERKEDLVLALYRRLAAELEAYATTLPADKLAIRFERIMQYRLHQIAPYRELLASIIGAALSPTNELGVLGSETADVRATERAVFERVVQGATDCPSEPKASHLTLLLYAAHLCLMLFWFYDRSPNQHATTALLHLSYDLLRNLRRILRWSLGTKTLARFAAAIEPVFAPPANSSDHTPATNSTETTAETTETTVETKEKRNEAIRNEW